MRLVLDCSVAIKCFVPEDGSAQAEEIAGRARSGEITLLAPEIIRVEFAHVLRKLVVGRDERRISMEAAQLAWADFQGLPLELRRDHPLVDRALALALEHRGTVYDAMYIALAETEELVVLTADGPMTKAFGRLGLTQPLLP